MAKSKRTPTPQRKLTGTPILIRVEDPILLGHIDKACGGVGGGGRSRQGGRSRWLLNLLYKTFGVPLPERKTVHVDLPDLQNVNLDLLDVKTRYIVELYNQGVSVKDIPALLTNQSIPTPRGSVWTDRSIKAILLRVARRQDITTRRQSGESVAKGAKGLASLPKRDVIRPTGVKPAAPPPRRKNVG